MNKELILGFAGLSMTLVGVVLAMGLFSNDPEQPVSAIKAVAVAQVVKSDASVVNVHQPGIQGREANPGIQNCFVSFVTAMCKLQGETGSSFFNRTMVCPTNLPRSG